MKTENYRFSGVDCQGIFVYQIEAQRSGFDLERRNDGAQPRKRREPQAYGVSEPCGVHSDDGTPGGTRTPDLLLRRQLLYPAELLAHISRAQIEAQRSGFDLERRNHEAQPKKRRSRRLSAFLSRAKWIPTMERVMGIEPTPTAWKAVVLAVILHPQLP